MKTLKPYIAFLFIPLIWVLCWFIYPEKVFYVKPMNGSLSTNVSTYSDSTDGGSSSISMVNSSNILRFKSTLREGHPFPYTGVVFFPKEEKYFDLSGFDELILTVETVNSKRLPITLGVEMNGMEVPLQFERELNEGKNSYLISMSSFNVPSWWFKNNGITASSLENINWSKIKAINIQNGSLMKVGEQDIITIYELKLKENATNFFLTGLASIVFVELVIFLIMLFKKNRRDKVIAVSYEVKKVKNIKDEEMEKLLHHISSHYHEPLNVEALQQATGVSKQKVPALFKEHLNMTLKQYLNTLRLNEAKRLLETSDIPVNEVAMIVGYGNISHFNRVFKANENKSPLQYRNQKKPV